MRQSEISFKIPSSSNPRKHLKMLPKPLLFGFNHLHIKHFCIFIVSDHKTMAVGDNILQRGTDAGDREKASVFLRSTNSTLATL